jgi:hypothetical protein
MENVAMMLCAGTIRGITRHSDAIRNTSIYESESDTAQANENTICIHQRMERNWKIGQDDLHSARAGSLEYKLKL